MTVRRAMLRSAAALAVLAALASSCAYYNTFYLARKYYDRGTGGTPYPLEPTTGAANQNFNKSIDYSKKVLGLYPKSKWVDEPNRILRRDADCLEAAREYETELEG